MLRTTLQIALLCIILSPSIAQKQKKMNKDKVKAVELRVDDWIDGDGNKLSNPLRLSCYEGKFKVLYGFQHWCPGCHKYGLPSLKKMVDALDGSDKVVFLAIQTVFEGQHKNTYDKIRETQLKYDLKIPFGHDDGSQAGERRSTLMTDYKSGGTPWFIFIDENNDVIFADFHINADAAIQMLKQRP